MEDELLTDVAPLTKTFIFCIDSALVPSKLNGATVREFL